MKGFAALLMFCVCAGSCAFANITDIQFSPGGPSPGKWSYDGAGTLSFSQMIDIDIVRGNTTDSLCSEFVCVPDLTLLSGNTIVTPDGPVEIKDNSGNTLLSGTLTSGDFISFFTIGALYTEYKNDITVTYVTNTIGSDLLDEVSVGAKLDFNLTLQAKYNFSYILNNGIKTGDGFSGSMDVTGDADVIPEPATICLLALGALGLARRKRS